MSTLRNIFGFSVLVCLLHFVCVCKEKRIRYNSLPKDKLFLGLPQLPRLMVYLQLILISYE